MRGEAERLQEIIDRQADYIAILLSKLGRSDLISAALEGERPITDELLRIRRARLDAALRDTEAS